MTTEVLTRKDFYEEARPDSNRGWRICNPTSNAINPGENVHFREGAAPGAADGAENQSVDPKVTLLLAAWPNLPAHLQAAILSIIESAEPTP